MRNWELSEEDAFEVENAFEILETVCHGNSVAHGWYETPEDNQPLTKIALMHSELSEALEEVRDGKPPIYFGPNSKPEGEAVELADAIIRIFDYAAWRKLPITEAFFRKHTYNIGRPHRHGGKLA